MKISNFFVSFLAMFSNFTTKNNETIYEDKKVDEENEEELEKIQLNKVEDEASEAKEDETSEAKEDEISEAKEDKLTIDTDIHYETEEELNELLDEEKEERKSEEKSSFFSVLTDILITDSGMNYESGIHEFQLYREKEKND